MQHPLRLSFLLLLFSMLLLAGCYNQQSSSENGSKFEWDLSKQRKFIYSYSQTVKGENKMDEDSPTKRSLMDGVGKLNVHVKENNLADLSLTDINLGTVRFNPDGSPRDTVTQKAPVSVVQDMKPNGRFSQKETDILFQILFPIPGKDLEIGETDEVPLEMPFNAMTSILMVKGQNTLRFRGYEEMEGRKCAVLDGKIDVSRLEVPEELEGKYKCATTGTAQYYFDLENHYYVGADIQMVMEVFLQTESVMGNGTDVYMSMVSDNDIKIRLEEIKE